MSEGRSGRRNDGKTDSFPAGAFVTGFIFALLAEMTEENPKVMLTDEEGKLVPIRHVIPVGLKTEFANHMTVQKGQRGEFFISFFEICPPLLIGDAEEIKLSSESIDAIQATCVVRLAIPSGLMPGVISALAMQLQRDAERHASQLRDSRSEENENAS